MLRLFLLSLLTVAVTHAASIPREQTHVVPQLEDGRIVGGSVVSITKHPHQVSMRRRSCEACSYSHICGGSIYNERVIVTAAHCVTGRTADQFMIVAGTDYRQGADGVIVPVQEIIVHEQYDVWSFNNDVALMILDLELPINNVTIKSIPLASQQPEDGVTSQVSGWGTTQESGMSSNSLQEVEVPIISNEKCKAAYQEEVITDSMLCAGFEDGGKDACQGDSGGPLVVNGELAGIVSWGYGCARPGYPGVYANVAYLKHWIESTINNDHGDDEDEVYVDFY